MRLITEAWNSELYVQIASKKSQYSDIGIGTEQRICVRARVNTPGQPVDAATYPRRWRPHATPPSRSFRAASETPATTCLLQFPNAIRARAAVGHDWTRPSIRPPNPRSIRDFDWPRFVRVRQSHGCLAARHCPTDCPSDGCPVHRNVVASDRQPRSPEIRWLSHPDLPRHRGKCNSSFFR